MEEIVYYLLFEGLLTLL